MEAIRSIDDNSDGMVDRQELFKAFKLMLNPYLYLDLGPIATNRSSHLPSKGTIKGTTRVTTPTVDLKGKTNGKDRVQGTVTTRTKGRDKDTLNKDTATKEGTTRARDI